MLGTHPKPMKQTTFAALTSAVKKNRTRREMFLDEMESVIEPSYPKAGRRGGQPKPMCAMLRIYFMRQWHTLSTYLQHMPKICPNRRRLDRLVQHRQPGCFDDLYGGRGRIPGD